MTLPRGLLLVATVNGEPVGCGALKLHPETATAEVKRMWTAPDARGLGIGRRLLARLEQEAADRNISTLRLETNRALVEAIAMYEHAGFRRVEAFNDEPYAHHWFEKSLSRPQVLELPQLRMSRGPPRPAHRSVSRACGNRYGALTRCRPRPRGGGGPVLLRPGASSR